MAIIRMLPLGKEGSPVLGGVHYQDGQHSAWLTWLQVILITSFCLLYDWVTKNLHK